MLPPKAATSIKPFGDGFPTSESPIAAQRSWIQKSRPRAGVKRYMDGTHGGLLAGWQPDYRLHQPGSGRQVLSGGKGARGLERDRPRKRAPARFAGACGDLLRHRFGAVHAVLLPRSPALPVGGLAVAAGPLGPGEGSR